MSTREEALIALRNLERGATDGVPMQGRDVEVRRYYASVIRTALSRLPEGEPDPDVETPGPWETPLCGKTPSFVTDPSPCVRPRGRGHGPFHEDGRKRIW